MSFGAKDLSKLRNDPEYCNWVVAGDALLFLSDGLRKYAEKKMKELHDIITKKVAKVTKVAGGVKCNCKIVSGKPARHATTCVWAKELKTKHVFKNKTHIPWHQSDSSKWHDPAVGYWEIAKLFMSDLGSDAAKVTDPCSTDIGPLLNLLRFCTHFNVQNTLLKAVTDRRNQWAHAPNHTLSDTHKKAAFQDIRLLLNDPELLKSKDIQDCGPKIKRIETAEISILEENERRVIKEFRRIKECETASMKDKADDKLILSVHILLFLMSNWRYVPGILRWLSFIVFFTFSQVSDRSGIVSDAGKIYCNTILYNSGECGSMEPIFHYLIR